MGKILLDDVSHAGGSSRLDVGSAANDGTGNTLRNGGLKLKQNLADLNTMLAEIYAGRIGVPTLATPPLANAISHFEDFYRCSVGPIPTTYGGTVVTPDWLTTMIGSQSLIGLYDSAEARSTTIDDFFGQICLTSGVAVNDLAQIDHGWRDKDGLRGGMWSFNPPTDISGVGLWRLALSSTAASLAGWGWFERIISGGISIGADWITDPDTTVGLASTSGWAFTRSTAASGPHLTGYTHGSAAAATYAAGDVVFRGYSDNAAEHHSFLVLAAGSFTAHTWHNYELAWDGTNFTVYLDGVSKGTWAPPGAAFIGYHASAAIKSLTTATKTMRIDCLYEERSRSSQR